MSKIHALRVGLVEGADFIGAFVKPNCHSPGYVARQYGIVDYNYTDYPDLTYRLNPSNSLEKVLEVFGIIVGATSNISLFLPQIAAYIKRKSNRQNHRITFYNNCLACIGTPERMEWGRKREQFFFEQLELLKRRVAPIHR